MISPELLYNRDTGEMALKIVTDGASIIHKCPAHVKHLSREDLKAYLDELIPKLVAELFEQKINKQRKRRRNDAKKVKAVGKKHKTNIKSDHIRPVKRAASATDEPT